MIFLIILLSSLASSLSLFIKRFFFSHDELYKWYHFLNTFQLEQSSKWKFTGLNKVILVLGQRTSAHCEDCCNLFVISYLTILMKKNLMKYYVTHDFYHIPQTNEHLQKYTTILVWKKRKLKLSIVHTVSQL